MADPISDMIIQIKNASAVGKTSVLISYSNLRSSIGEVLKREGFVEGVVKKVRKGKKFLEIALRYEEGAPRIKGVARVSKPSRRVYVGSRGIRPVRRGFGRLILSTPKGVLTGEAARKERVGGEPLFKIW